MQALLGADHLEVGERTALELADAFAADAEFLPDLVKGLRVRIESESLPEDALLPGRKTAEGGVQVGPKGRRHRVLIGLSAIVREQGL